MIEVFKNLLGSNHEFAASGLLLMIIGGLGVYLRTLPRRLWEWLAYHATMMITVQNDDAAFVWVKEWFLEQDFVKRIRRVDLDTTLRGENIALIPAPGEALVLARRQALHRGVPSQRRHQRLGTATQ